MSVASDIKDAIKTHLTDLVTANTLGEVQVDDFRKAIFERDFSAYPAAVLTSPATTGAYLDSGNNTRTYMYEVIVIQKIENIASADDIETLAETILDVFDNDQLLGGAALGGVIPSSTRPEPALLRGNSIIYFGVLLQAKAIKQLD